MVTCSYMWLHVVTCKRKVLRWVIYGYMQLHVITRGDMHGKGITVSHLWLHVVSCGYTWWHAWGRYKGESFMVAGCYMWLHVVTCMGKVLRWVIYGCMWFHLVTRGDMHGEGITVSHLWLQVVTCEYTWWHAWGRYYGESFVVTKQCLFQWSNGPPVNAAYVIWSHLRNLYL